VAVEVSIGPRFNVAFSFQGNVRVPPPAPSRFVDGLWQHTCFEVFAARPGMPGYQEFNLSPSGEYAVYSFNGYRAGMTQLKLLPAITFHENRLEALIPLKGPLRLGLSAVIEEESGRKSYWALKHAPGRPDFHHPDAFALELP
jgi:hypothetical protein